ncbi:TRI29 protein, partial [Polypterus senegalus]
MLKWLKNTTIPSPFQKYAGPADVKCDYCASLKFWAMKTCLTYTPFLCEIHLQPHFTAKTLKNHKITELDIHLEKKLCVKYQNILDTSCKTDQMCICILCKVTEHNGHEFVDLEEETEKQKLLRATWSETKRKLEESEKTLEDMKRRRNR